MYCVKRKIILLTCCLTVSITSLSGQSSLDSLQLLNEVVVTSNYISKEVIPVQTLSSEQLTKLSVHSVADAIRYFAGVQIKDFGGIGGLKTVNIRSMGTQHVGVFYDGIELGNAQNGTTDLGRFSLDNMQSITIYNGQKSAIFQPAKDFGSSGSIYMVTRTPYFKGTKKNNTSIKVRFGSFGTVNPSFLWEHRINKSVSTSFNTEYLYTTGRYSFSYSKKNGYDSTEIRRNGDVSAMRMEGALFGKINKGEWKTKIYFYNSERGYPGASVREEPGKFKNQDRQWDNNLFIQGSVKKTIKTFYSTLLSAKYAFDYLHYLSDPRLDVSTMYINNHYYQHEYYLSSANQFTLLPFWKADISADYQLNTLSADLYDFVYPTRHTTLIAAASSINLNLFKLQGSLLCSMVHDQTKVEGSAAGDKRKLTPAVIFSWNPFRNETICFRGFYKRIFRMPTLNDLYYTFIGNKDLNPEYTTQFDLGVTYTGTFKEPLPEQLELQADIYYNKVTDKIIAMPTSNQFRWTMVNLGLVRIKGLDLSIKSHWSIRKKLEISTSLNYTYQQARDMTDPESNYYGGQIPYIPWHSGSFILNCDYDRWYLNYSFIYTGDRYESQANIPENYAMPWYTSDISVSKTFMIKKNESNLTAEVNNLFNQQYEVVQCYPMPGINYKIILKISL